MAGGVVSALEKKGLAGKIVVTGQDATLDALQRIAEGKQTMTVYKPIIQIANQAVEAAIKLADKEKLETRPFMNDVINKEIGATLPRGPSGREIQSGGHSCKGRICEV